MILRAALITAAVMPDAACPERGAGPVPGPHLFAGDEREKARAVLLTWENADGAGKLTQPAGTKNDTPIAPGVDHQGLVQ